MRKSRIPLGRVQAGRDSSGITPGKAPVKVHACIDMAVLVVCVTVPRQDPIVRRDPEISTRIEEVVARPVKVETAGEGGQEKPEVLHVGVCSGLGASDMRTRLGRSEKDTNYC